MIKVVIIDEKRVIDSIVDKADENTRVAWAQENESNPGYCVFTEAGEIKAVVDRDNVFELLIRSALNHLDLNGVERAYTVNPALVDETVKLGFNRNGDISEVKIKEFFKPCCC